MVSRTSASNGLWHPFRDLVRLQNDLGRLFNDSLRPVASEGPAFNVWKNDHGVIVTAELPGLDISSLDVSVVGDSITVAGQKMADSHSDDARVQRRERSVGKFSRTFKLPYRIDTNRTEASYQNGVLSVELPMLEDEKRKQITVKAAGVELPAPVDNPAPQA